MVSVGRIERYKGHHKAIEALPHLLKTRPEARVEILGAGPYEAELLALAEELGVARPGHHPVHPAGGPGADGGAHRPAGVMTLLSDYEAHPVAVMEALTAGRPAVVSRTSGLTELADLGWAVGVDQHATRGGDRARHRAPARRPRAPGPVGPAHMGDVCGWCGRYL